MSIITFDGKTVAADTRTTRGSTILPDHSAKLKEVGGVVFGITGVIHWFDAWIDAYWRWREDSHHLSSQPLKTPFTQGNDAENHGGQFLVFDHRGGTRFFRSFYWEMPYPYPITTPAAWGSGAHYALGAMRKGNAIDGVEAAIEYDCYCGGRIDAFDVATAKRIELTEYRAARLHSRYMLAKMECQDGTIIPDERGAV
jgi:hypothetical protein